MTKNELRAYIKQQKRQYTSQQLRVLSLSVINRLLAHPRMQAAQSVLLFHSLPDEVFTHHAIEQLFRQGRQVFLPVVVGDGLMQMGLYAGSEALHQGAFHILEPEPVTEATVDVAVVPGVAFDAQGNRLGRGKGYYDRFLSLHPEVYKLGLCFPFQLVSEVPASPHDVPVDEVIC
ncbi:MAG: 5-formyltetrahydrofolate cyclo-ligase [Prevotella sp.]|nr:5-formyltetrahydrofolate cyclo-ligase [Prevotella sp.]